MICQNIVRPSGIVYNTRTLAKKWKEMFGTKIVNGVEVFNRIDINAEICEDSDLSELFNMFGFNDDSVTELCSTYESSKDSVDALFYEPSKKLSSTRTHWEKHKEIIQSLISESGATKLCIQYMNEKSDELMELDNVPYWEYFYAEDLTVDDFGDNRDPLDTRDTMDDDSNSLYISRTAKNAFKYAYLFATDDNEQEVTLDERILHLLRVFIWGSQRRLIPTHIDSMRYTTPLEDTGFVFERTYLIDISVIMDDWDNLYEKFTSPGTEEDKRLVYLRNEPLTLSADSHISTWYMLSEVLEDKYESTGILVVDDDDWYVSYDGLYNATQAEYEMVMPMVMQLGYVGTSNGIIQDLMAGILKGIMDVMVLAVDIYHDFTLSGLMLTEFEEFVEDEFGITVEEMKYVEARILTALLVSYITGGGEIGALESGATYASQAMFVMNMGSTIMDAHSEYEVMEAQDEYDTTLRQIAKEKELVGERKLDLRGRSPAQRRYRGERFNKMKIKKIRKDRTYGCRYINL